MTNTGRIFGVSIYNYTFTGSNCERVFYRTGSFKSKQRQSSSGITLLFNLDLFLLKQILWHFCVYIWCSRLFLLNLMLGLFLVFGRKDSQWCHNIFFSKFCGINLSLLSNHLFAVIISHHNLLTMIMLGIILTK